MNLSKMFPKKESFKVKSLNAKFELRHLTVEDEIWMINELSEDYVRDLGKLDLITGTRMAFRLMHDEDKLKYLKKESRDFVAEDGEVVTREIGGLVLLQSVMTGQDEQIEMFDAVFQTIINSRPDEKEVKKKDEETEETESEEELVGWDVIFDLFSSEYGWLMEDILKLTRRQVDWSLRAMGERLDKRFKLDAALHGMPIEEKKEAPGLSEDKQNKLDAMIEKRMAGAKNG